MRLPVYLTCLLRNLNAGQEATVRTGHGTMDWFQIGKGVHQGYILSPCLFNLCAEYIMQNARLDEAQAGIKIAGRNINKSQICRWHHPCGRKRRGTKELPDESETGEWKSCLQFTRSVVSNSLGPPWSAACQASLSITNTRSLLKADLKLNIQKSKSTESGSITSRQIGKKWKL